MSSILRSLKRSIDYAHTEHYHPSRAVHQKARFIALAKRKQKLKEEKAAKSRVEVKRKVLEK